QASLQGGAAASGRRVGKLEIGARADFLVLDDQHPNLHGLNTSAVLNTFVFVGNDKLVRDVFVGGKQVVTEGRHHAQESVAKDFVACMRQLRGA
ncbi:MAG: amidohydrolase family protein, partial [Burkholderiaceae bacterium]|nr:amidohydrolase family protein [Burkholderiaceae bacterium]